MAGPRRKNEASGVAAAVPSAWQRLKARLSLPGMEAWSTNVRNLFLNGLFLLAIVVVLPVLIGQFRRDQVIIEPISVPEALENQGLTANVAANRVWDGLQDVVRKSNTSKQSIDAIPDSRRVEFSFPDSGFSVESLVFHLRRLFNAYDTRIAGEFVCADKGCDPSGLRLRLRVVRQGVDLIDLPPIGARAERDYFADAGAQVLSLLDPFVALSALSESQPVKATTLARRLIRAHHKDAKWAHNLVGLIRVNGGDAAAAIEEFRAAIALDPAFPPARANLGGALLGQGDIAGAQAEFEALLADDARNVWALRGLADVALARNDPDTAVARLLAAAEADPVNPDFFARAGKVELDRNRKDEAVRLLKRSLELDPGYLPAFAFLAAMHLTDGDHGAAERIYRDAADYAPEDADAQASHGRMLAILHDWPGAAARYERAAALEPTNATYWFEYGRCLQKLPRLDDAMAALEKARALDPANADVMLSIADVHRDAGRNPQAVAAYKAFLELDKGDSPMRAIAERYIELLSN